MSQLTLDQSKYGKDAAFADPVVRCDSCQELIFIEDLHKLGSCYCGHRRVRNCMTLTSEEIAKMKQHAVDDAFIALFEPSEVQNG